MKRILVIDDSEMVRETLALVLGREFVIQKRALGNAERILAEAEHDIDLVILGLTPAAWGEALRLVRFAAHFPFAVLLLVDSKAAAKTIEVPERIECLAKPFDPYELREKVGRLLSRSTAYRPSPRDHRAPAPESSRYLEFPFVTRAAATLIPRFAAATLPVLISGEIGCGQDRIARAMGAAMTGADSLVSLHCPEVSPDYLAEKDFELQRRSNVRDGSVVLMLENLDGVSPAGQSALLAFLEEQQQRGMRGRLLSTSRVDLLRKVYAGEFLEGLFYRLATLSLTLPPLRDRSGDIPVIAAWFAQQYAERLGIGAVSLSADANRRLCNYLWFGNLSEIETVIARTLALHRQPRVDGADLIFDFSSDVPSLELSDPAAAGSGDQAEAAAPWRAPANGVLQPPRGSNGNHFSGDLKSLIHELAHELKNPMVTIKTFAQLLSDRYEDENFRTRFQNIVGGDIERMDELLEAMIEFADFPQPQARRVSLEERLRAALEELKDRYAERQAEIRWRGNGQTHEIFADDAQLKYVFKNVMAAVLAQTKPGSEIEIDLERQGALAISYVRELPRVGSISQYLTVPSQETSPAILPLRVLLAKQLIERNGGRMALDTSDSERDILKMEFLIS